MSNEIKVTKTVRLAEELAKAADAKAAALGITFSDLLSDAVAKELGMTRDPAVALSLALASFLGARYSRDSFPPDVTRIGFRYVRLDPVARALFDKAITRHDGTVDERRKATLNRKLGRLVKQVLNAQVVGRSGLLDSSVELIETHALLAPTPAVAELRSSP